MDQSIENLDSLYDNTVNIYSNILGQTGEHILENINGAINDLKTNWHGRDAGVQIQGLTTVYNEFIDIYNNLELISVGMSKICRNYRNIQVAFKTQKEEKNILTYNKKTHMLDYTDTDDRIDINEKVKNSVSKLESAISSYDSFMKQNKMMYDNIINNWTTGYGRDKLLDLYDSFFSKEEVYKEGLNIVTNSIKTALDNYVFNVE